MKTRSAISAIEKAGALLVFPMENRKEPASLWSHFHPRKEMSWEWDDAGNAEVHKLWHLRSALSTTRKVIYTKWFRDRATCISRPLFAPLLRSLNPDGDRRESLSPDARKLLEVLEGESPLSTKELKRMSGLKGSDYEKAMKPLWSRLLIVAFGEVDDGAFPSLAIGATRVLFEELWAEAFDLSDTEAQGRIGRILPPENLFFRHYLKTREKLAGDRGKEPPKKGNRKKDPTPKRAVPSVIRFKDL